MLFQPLQKMPQDRRLDATPLGEIGGRLFPREEQALYSECGGASYNAVRVANDRLVPVAHHYLNSNRDGFATTKEMVLNAVRRHTKALLPLAAYLVPLPETPSALSDSPQAEVVSAVAFHPHHMTVAVAVSDAKSSRVRVFDATEGAGDSDVVLEHAFQHEVRCVSWKPFAKDVLAVGCRGGVLLWKLAFVASQETAAAAAIKSDSAACVFYPCSRGSLTTCVAFSNGNGQYLAAASEHSIYLHFHDIAQSPTSSLAYCATTVDGGTSCVAFAASDAFAVKGFPDAPLLGVISLPSFATRFFRVSQPLLDVQRLQSGSSSKKNTSLAPPETFVLHLKHVEGLVIAVVRPDYLHIVARISTGLSRGVGGAVKQVRVSDKRVFVLLQSGHVLSLHCSCQQNESSPQEEPLQVALRAIGCFPCDAHATLTVFDGFKNGALLGIVERNETWACVPSYYA